MKSCDGYSCDDDDDGNDDDDADDNDDDDAQVSHLDVDQLSGLLPARPKPPLNDHHHKY